ncbi:hypothetical protein HPP92_016384 [Vanilla planifolia]|uniref:Uncharacterized protein n=1 Tax=Vanilla planifolia TaxID=51239 RepID=A0A835QI01_VANPL|nr:hypothetical protein HPP92_016384 [Vanilla planifolia]
MALLTFSSRLPTPKILPAIVLLKSKLLRGNTSQLGSPAKTSFASLSFLSFLGQSTTQASVSKCCAGAAWQPPKYVYPDPNPEFARAVSLLIHSERANSSL